MIEQIVDRLRCLQIEGLICIGGDGTLNGMQALSDYLPTVLAPKTIDNDLGLKPIGTSQTNGSANRATLLTGYRYKRGPSRIRFDVEQMVNYVTPGFATSVFVSASGVQRIRTQPKAIGASPSSRSWAGTLVSGVGGRLRSAGHLCLCLSLHSISTGWSSECWKFTSCNRMS